MQRYSKGQEAIEFILITALVFFGAFFTVMIFGEKLQTFFAKGSSIHQVSNNTSGLISVSSSPKYKADFETEAQEEVINQSAGSYDYQTNEQGDVMFQAAGQDVMLSADVVSDLQTVFETSGADGLEDMMDEITSVINDEKANYPDSNVPIEIMFGDGERVWLSNKNISYSGTAEVNSYSLKVGNKVVIVQNDQQISGEQGGRYRIEGMIDSNNKFLGQVTSNSTQNLSGSFSADYKNGNIENGLFNATYKSYQYGWNIDFSKNR